MSSFIEITRTPSWLSDCEPEHVESKESDTYTVRVNIREYAEHGQAGSVAIDALFVVNYSAVLWLAEASSAGSGSLIGYSRDGLYMRASNGRIIVIYGDSMFHVPASKMFITGIGQ